MTFSSRETLLPQLSNSRSILGVVKLLSFLVQGRHPHIRPVICLFKSESPPITLDRDVHIQLNRFTENLSRLAFLHFKNNCWDKSAIVDTSLSTANELVSGAFSVWNIGLIWERLFCICVDAGIEIASGLPTCDIQLFKVRALGVVLLKGWKIRYPAKAKTRVPNFFHLERGELRPMRKLELCRHYKQKCKFVSRLRLVINSKSRKNPGDMHGTEATIIITRSRPAFRFICAQMHT